MNQMTLDLPGLKEPKEDSMSEDERILALEPIFEVNYATAAQASVVNVLALQLARILPHQMTIRVRSPIDLGPHIIPDPSIVICKKREDNYRLRHPKPADIYLVIEVIGNLHVNEDSRFDTYRDFGVGKVWGIDVENKMVMNQDNLLNESSLLYNNDLLSVPETEIVIKAASIFN
jgi:hypothetical protein